LHDAAGEQKQSRQRKRQDEIEFQRPQTFDDSKFQPNLQMQRLEVRG
jgi:hypothetical protein